MSKNKHDKASKEVESQEIPIPEAIPTSQGGHESSGNTGLDAMTQLQTDVEKFRDLALRSQADLDNFRKRVTREREDAVRFANASLIEQLLPVIDSFELGLDAARQSPEGKDILKGFEMVLRQLEDFLRSQNVEVVDAMGATFDHHLHDAMAQEESSEVPEGTVIRQIRKGYKLRERLIRPAAVVVSKGKTATKG